MTPPTRRPLERAAEHLAAGRFAEAAGAFRAALQIDPTLGEAMLGLAECALGRGQTDAAFDHLVAAARTSRDKGDGEDALAIYCSAVEVDPDRLDVHVDIAELEAELGQIDQARTRLEGLALAYENAGRYEDAAAIVDFVGQWDEPEPIGDITFVPDIGAPEAIDHLDRTVMCPTMLIAPFGHPLPMIVPEIEAPQLHGDTVRAPMPEPVVEAAVVVETAPPVERGRVTEVPYRVPSPRAVEAAPRVEAPPVVATPRVEAPPVVATPRVTIPPAVVTPRVTIPPVVVLPRLVAVPPAPVEVAPEPVEPEVVVDAPPSILETAPTPSSLDAKGRSLAQRLREHRGAAKAAAAKAAAAPTKPASAPTQSKPAVAAKPAPAAKPAVAAKPAPAAKPEATAKPAPIAKPAATKPAPAAKPAAATAKPAAAKPAPIAKPAAAKPAPVAKPAAPKPAPVAKPAPAARPTAASGAVVVASVRPRPSTPARVSTPPATRPAPAAAASAKPAPTRAPAVRPMPTVPPAPAPGPTMDSAVTSPRARVPRRSAAPGTPHPAAPAHTKPLVIPKPGTQEFDDQRTVLYRPSAHS